MKQALAALVLLLAAALGGGAHELFAEDAAPLLQGYSTVRPLRHISTDQVMSAVASQTTVPMWSYKITSPADNMNYTGVMVGSSPFFNGLRTTNIPAVLVPLIIVMPDGGVFDPTAFDSCASGAPVALMQGSPSMLPTMFSMNGINLGTSQYADAFQRGNFYSANVSATGNSYHTVLSPITTLSPVTIHIPASEGATYQRGCAEIGVVDFNTFDSIITGTVIPQLAAQNVGPTTFPLLMMHDVVMADPGTSISSNCCILGYHGAFGNPVQTYAPFDYDSTSLFLNEDISVASHEISEWMDDPLGTNPTPAWGHVGQVTGCQNNLEVGDPLTARSFGSITMPDGVTYHPQELAFYSWFFRQNPSIGAGHKYSDNSTFTTTAGSVCQ